MLQLQLESDCTFCETQHNNRDTQMDIEVLPQELFFTFFTFGTLNKADIIKYPFSFIYVTRTLFVPINRKATSAPIQYAFSSISCAWNTKAITCYILK